MPGQAGAIVFDLDNTLVHSQIDFAGIRRDLGELLLANGAVGEPIVTEGPKRRSIGQIIELGERHDAEHGTRLGRRMWRIVEEYERAGMRLATVEPDAGPTLAELRCRGHPIGVLTNNARTSALEALRKFGLLPYIDATLGREDVPAMKPSPSGLLVARERLAPRAAGLLMVGDSYLDGLAARGAGWPFVAFRPRPGDLEERGIEPVAVISDLRELLDLQLSMPPLQRVVGDRPESPLPLGEGQGEGAGSSPAIDSAERSPSPPPSPRGRGGKP